MKWHLAGRSLGLAALLAGCRHDPAPPSPAGSASAAAPSSPEKLLALRSAEDRRDVAAITDEDVNSADVKRRRGAARALARIGSEETRAGLLKLLGDEDAEVVSFAAYGLGWTCREHEDEHVKALAARSTSLPAAAGAFDPQAATARALGKCGTAEAEGVLVAWLSGPRPRGAAAALGLGDAAGRRPLKADTVVALTKAASDGLGEALFAFGRGEPPGETVAGRVREVAAQRLSVEDETRIFAVRALGRTDDAAAPELKKVLGGKFSDAERAEAARALARLKAPGQQALGDALGELLPPPGDAGLAALVSSTFGPLTAALEALKAPPPRAAADALRALAAMPVPDEQAPVAVRRRVVRLRCLAARLLADQPDEAIVLGCDPAKESRDRDLARLAVLGREPIKGARRLAALRGLLASRDARVRSEALELLGSHREVDATAGLLQGLRHEHPGTVAAAAKALASRPEVSDGAVEAAVLAALDRPFAPDDVEVISALLRAVGALRASAGRKHLDRHCKSFSPTLRANAQGALALLGDRQTRCLAAPPAQSPAPELGKVAGPVKVVLETDAGELTLSLDPATAPGAVGRLVDLAEASFYDGIEVHRVVPGFVVQFGDRAGDGTGGAKRDTLRCETAPLPFAPLSVGVALDGRDTGSSQFFVTLARTPHLDGEYTRLGSASGDWSSVTEGDRILKARVVR